MVHSHALTGMKNASDMTLDAFIYFFDAFLPPFQRDFMVTLQQNFK